MRDLRQPRGDTIVIVRHALRPLAALILLVLLGLVGAACSGEAEEPGARESTAPQPPKAPAGVPPPIEPPAAPAPDGISVVALPPVAQPGDEPASLDAATRLVVAQVRPAAPGGVVRLEREEGDRWRPVGTARQDATGHATFTALTDAPGRYRAVVRGGGRSEVVSDTVESVAWSTAFTDDFDGSTLDASLWDYRQLGFYNDTGGRVCSKSDPSAVDVSEGTLRLLVRADPARAGEECLSADGTHDYYLNGHVATEGKFDFTYGVAAARVRFQEGRGQHGAFWLQRQVPRVIPGDPLNSGAEIDVAEFFGEGYPQGGLAAFTYFLDQGEENEKVGGVHPEATQELPEGDDWWRSYHVFSVEWTPERYVFRVDGREFFRTDQGISGVDQFLVLSLLTSDWELDRLDRSSLPSRMDVDWVRVWQRPDA